MKTEISVEKNSHNGHLILRAIVGTQTIKKVFIGYSKKESIRIFKQELKRVLK